MGISKSLVKDFIRKVSFNTLRKKIDEKAISWSEVVVNKEDVVYFCLSTNPVVSINYNNNQYYFRECINLSSKKDFLHKRITCFFKFINNNNFHEMGFKQELPIKVDFEKSVVDEFSDYMNDLCSDEKFINKMLQIDVNLRKIGYSIWINPQEIDIETLNQLGLKDLDEKYFDIALYFIWQMRSASNVLRNANLVRGKNLSYFSASRTISTQIVAENLGLNKIVPESEWCKLKIDDIEFFGVLSKAAEGVRGCDCKIEPSVELQQRLTELHLFDVICFQQDHGPNNYNIYVEDGKEVVCAFDNDNDNTFFPISRIDLSLSGCSPLFDGKGNIKRDVYSNELSKKIINTDINNLCKLLKPFLNLLQRNALKNRFIKVKKSLELMQNKNISVNKNNSALYYLEKELSKEYGETYLTRLLDRINISIN